MIRNAGHLLAFAGLNLLLGTVGFFHWGVQFGFLFSVLWLQPLRRWPWLLAVAFLCAFASAGMSWFATRDQAPFLWFWPGPGEFVIGNLSPLAVAAGAFILKCRRISGWRVPDLQAMRWLHMAVLAAAVLASLKDVAYVLYEGRVGDIRLLERGNYVALGADGDWQVLGYFFLTHLVGAFVGGVMVATLAWWMGSRRRGDGSRAVLVAGALYLLPVGVAYVLLASRIEVPGFQELLRLALVAGSMIFALTHGWRGAALALFATSTAIGVQEHLVGLGQEFIWMQLFVAIVGSLGLLLGTALDDMRAQRLRLDEAGRNEAALAADLRAAALRNVRAEEDERRRVAAELHDELGQAITALQTRVALRTPADRDGDALRDEVRSLAGQMRRNVAHLLDALHPPALQTLGLYGALDRGPLRLLATQAGLDYTTTLQGDARLIRELEPAVSMALYRIAQSAVTNVVRHAPACECEVRLRLARRGGRLLAFVRVCDDGGGVRMPLREGHGLRAMRDRVDALGGRLVLRNGRAGFVVHAVVPQSGEGDPYAR